MSTLTPRTRPRRSSSVIEYLARAGSDPEHHLAHLGVAREDPSALPDPIPPSAPSAPTTPRPASKHSVVPTSLGPKWLQWVQNPWESFTLIAIALSGSLAFKLAFPSSSTTDNPFMWFWYISYPVVPTHAGEDQTPRYRKGPRDVLYVIGWVVVLSCIRQSLRTPLFALGRRLGIKRTRKLERFMEQGYAALYFACSSSFGLYVMSQQDSWWYKTEHFWLKYPHWDMTGIVKSYYLTQLAYWCQQALVMIAGLEKPRDDYTELILHHCITLWLVLASYVINLTQIGIAVFVSMDIPDVVFAISKCINYVGLERTSNCSFVIFISLWSYFRHYQEFRILHSVWTQFDLIPAHARIWDPLDGYWMSGWMQWQVFTPIFLLQLLMIFWSYLILRVLFRMFKGVSASDVREEDETETEAEGDDAPTEVKKATGVARGRKQSGTSDAAGLRSTAAAGVGKGKAE